MSLASQVKLLTILHGGLRPVGAHSEIPVNVRAIVATNRILEREVSAGRFLEDLYYRIAILTIHLPPFREPFLMFLQWQNFFAFKQRGSSERKRPEELKEVAL
jgi:transcriptional regulator with GAF, ATPase, and Fis domain